MLANSETSYSKDALKALPWFSPGKILVVLEGPAEDKDFWRPFFELGGARYTLEFVPVGGKPEVEKAEQALVEAGPLFVVAKDSDFNEVFNRTCTLPSGVETYVHSIENAMICECKILKILERHSRSAVAPSYISGLFVKFNSVFGTLFAKDALSCERELGHTFMRDACDEFYVLNSGKTELAPDEVKKRENSGAIPNPYLGELIRIARDFVPVAHSRGHFVFSYFRKEIFQYVKQTRKSFSLSVDGFYSDLLERCKQCEGILDCQKRIGERARNALGVVAKEIGL